MRHKPKSNVLRNQIFNCDCVEGMSRLPEECIDLVVTSPPYDNKFVYGGHPWNFEVFKRSPNNSGGSPCQAGSFAGKSRTKARAVLHARSTSKSCTSKKPLGFGCTNHCTSKQRALATNETDIQSRSTKYSCCRKEDQNQSTELQIARTSRRVLRKK